MKYSISKIHKKVNEEFRELICICASDGENVSIIAQIHECNICEEHGTPESWAEKIVELLRADKITQLFN